MTVLVHLGEQFAQLGRESPDGGPFLANGAEYTENPRFLFHAPDAELLRLWQLSRPNGLGGGGLTFSERMKAPAKLLDAFEVFEVFDVEARKGRASA